MQTKVAWKTIPDFLRYSFQKFPNKIALDFESKTYTYKDLWHWTDQVSSFLIQQTKKSEIVAILLPNSADFVVSYFSVLKSNLIVLLLPSNISDNTLQFQMKKTQAKFIISEKKYLNKLTRSGVLKNCTFFDIHEVTYQGKILSRKPQKNDISTIIFTSGTTSEPKGVVLRHTNVVNATKNIIEYLKFNHHDKDVNISQLSHSFGLAHLHCLFAVGGTVILFRDAINQRAILQAIIDKRATTFGAVPAILRLLTSHYEKELKKCGKYLRMVQTNTSPLEKELIEKILTLLPKTNFSYYYGLTEASRATFITFNEVSDKYASVGKASPNVQVKIVTNHKKARPYVPGEICIKGKMVIKEYWKNIVASRAIQKGWFHTGDYGYLDDDGYLFFQGRKDDIINVSGEKVLPEQIEYVIKGTSGVIDACVVGFPDKLFGEVPKAFITVSEKQFDVKLVIDRCRQFLESYKIPRQVEIIDTIPRTENGKLQRSLLRNK